MSAAHSDRALLAALITIAESVLSPRPFVWPTESLDLAALAADLVTAIRRPCGASRLGDGEAILFTALQKITSGGSPSQADLSRFAFIAQQALAIVRDHYFAIVKAEAIARARGEVS